MRLVLQRVLSASVTVDKNTVGQIGPGIMCLVGIGQNDSLADLEWAYSSIMKARLWPNQTGEQWKRALPDLEYEVLIVSQFTLHGFLKGNKPDFHNSMPPKKAEQLFQQLVEKCKQSYQTEKVQTGTFGTMMEVHVVNSGPVTVSLDSEACQ